jgi:RNA polymerase sigma-70 factor (ECF subfamily)
VPEHDLVWEKRCLGRIRKGDMQAFGELYNAFSNRLFRRVLLPLLGDRSAAEDALAETFKTALEKIDKFEEKGVSVFHWLARIGKNKALDMHRSRERTGRALCNFEGMLKPLLGDSPLPGNGLQAEEEGRRLRQAVAAVLEKLNPRYKKAIELRFLQDRPRKECAEMLELKLGTFDVLVLRALRAFKKEWEEQT